MSSCAKVVISATLVACHHHTFARERALALLPAEPTIVAVADWRRWRRPSTWRGRTCPGFGCVIDAALSADAAALAHGPRGTIEHGLRRAVAARPAIPRDRADRARGGSRHAPRARGAGSGAAWLAIDAADAAACGSPRRCSCSRRATCLLGIDSHRVTSAGELAQLAGRLPKRVRVAVRRGEIDGVIEVAEE